MILTQIQQIYGDKPVVAAIPVALEGRAKQWFRSLTTELSRPEMGTVDGWIALLEESFPIDKLETRRLSKNRKYNPEKDEDVLAYVLEKIELLKAENRRINELSQKKEIWLGLSTDFHNWLDEDSMMAHTMQDFQRILKSKDRGFRAQRRMREREKDRIPSNLSARRSSSKMSSDAEKPPFIKKLDGLKKKENLKSNSDEKKRKPLHPCHHGSEWHYDNECPNPKKTSLPSFYLIDQNPRSETEKEPSPGKGSSPDADSDAESGQTGAILDYHTTTNSYRRIAKFRANASQGCRKGSDHREAKSSSHWLRYLLPLCRALPCQSVSRKTSL